MTTWARMAGSSQLGTDQGNSPVVQLEAAMFLVQSLRLPSGME